jgi:hypothetical protein
MVAVEASQEQIASQYGSIFFRAVPVLMFLPGYTNMTNRLKLILADAAVAFVMAVFAIALVLRFATGIIVWN